MLAHGVRATALMSISVQRKRLRPERRGGTSVACSAAAAAEMLDATAAVAATGTRAVVGDAANDAAPTTAAPAPPSASTGTTEAPWGAAVTDCDVTVTCASGAAASPAWSPTRMTGCTFMLRRRLAVGPTSASALVKVAAMTALVTVFVAVADAAVGAACGSCTRGDDSRDDGCNAVAAAASTASSPTWRLRVE